MSYDQAWLDPASGKAFCLVTGPSREAVMRVHERAGHPTDQVFELPIEAELIVRGLLGEPRPPEDVRRVDAALPGAGPGSSRRCWRRTRNVRRIGCSEPGIAGYGRECWDIAAARHVLAVSSSVTASSSPVGTCWVWSAAIC